MNVIHVLKDGSRIDDIRGHLVKYEDARPLYDLINRINRRAVKESEVHTRHE